MEGWRRKKKEEEMEERGRTGKGEEEKGRWSMEEEGKEGGKWPMYADFIARIRKNVHTTNLD